jgi:hypothetical protein
MTTRYLNRRESRKEASDLRFASERGRAVSVDDEGANEEPFNTGNQGTIRLSIAAKRLPNLWLLEGVLPDKYHVIYFTYTALSTAVERCISSIFLFRCSLQRDFEAKTISAMD